MDYINPFIKVNAGGIPRLEALSVDSTAGLVYTFKKHRFLQYPYAGLLIFKLPKVTTTATAGNVYFNSGVGTSNVQVFNYSGSALDGENESLAAGGVFLGWYADGVVQLLTGV